MNEAESIEYLKKLFHIRTNSKGLLLLVSIKNLLQKSKYLLDANKRQIGKTIIGIASTHGLTDKQLLKFFDVTMGQVKESVGEKFLKEHGLYRALVCTASLSPTCELFFDAWFAAAYEKYPMSCQLRRVGADAFRIVSILPDGSEVEYPDTMTAAEVLEATTCPKDELLEMPVLQ